MLKEIIRLRNEPQFSETWVRYLTRPPSLTGARKRCICSDWIVDITPSFIRRRKPLLVILAEAQYEQAAICLHSLHLCYGEVLSRPQNAETSGWKSGLKEFNSGQSCCGSSGWGGQTRFSGEPVEQEAERRGAGDSAHKRKKWNKAQFVKYTGTRKKQKIFWTWLIQ